MILSELEKVENEQSDSNYEEVAAEFKENLSPGNFSDQLEAFAAKTSGVLSRQVVQGMESGFPKVANRIEKPFSLGYLTGFTMGYLETKGSNNSDVKILVLKSAFDFVFGKSGMDVFVKVGRQLRASNYEYKTGIKAGMKEAYEYADRGKEPKDLKLFLLNEKTPSL